MSGSIVDAISFLLWSVAGIHIAPFAPTKIAPLYSFCIAATAGIIHGLITASIIVTLNQKDLIGIGFAGVGAIAVILSGIFLASFPFVQAERHAASVFQTIIGGVIFYFVILFVLSVPFFVIGLITGKTPDTFRN